jgi:2-polyprenyl-6-methoxyphenol hydroxylase-like FAD-dependent oxidoreductase
MKLYGILTFALWLSSSLSFAAPAALDYDLIVSGAGPGGLQAAISAIRNGVKPSRILILEKREPGDAKGDYGTRSRVEVLDGDSIEILEQSGLSRLPGVPLQNMVLYRGKGPPNYMPNSGGWKEGMNTFSGGRSYERLVILGDLEKLQLAAMERQSETLKRAGVEIEFGQETNLKFDADGNGYVDLKGKKVTAKLIAVMDGASSDTAKDLVHPIAVAPEKTSRYLSIDVPVTSHGDARPGDLISSLDAGSRTVIYAFVSDWSASVTALLPDDADLSRPSERQKYLKLLKSAAAKFGLPGEPLVPEGVTYDGALSMLDRSGISNVVFGGDKLRKVDPIAGTGANAALRDGDRIGAYFSRTRDEGGSPERAMRELRHELRETTRFVFEHSLFFRELADWMRDHPAEATLSYAMGLSERKGRGGLMDLAKNLTSAFAIPSLRDALVKKVLKARTGVSYPFESPERTDLIGEVHPVDAARGCLRRQLHR